jgi:hypothetical protein
MGLAFMRMGLNQCECGRPVPQSPQELGWPLQDAASDEFSPPLEANSDSFFVNRLDPHLGHAAPFV